jgi:hypothetical protein
MISWNVDPKIWRDNVCSIATRNLTPKELREWLPGTTVSEDYKTCPNLP